MYTVKEWPKRNKTLLYELQPIIVPVLYVCMCGVKGDKNGLYMPFTYL